MKRFISALSQLAQAVAPTWDADGRRWPCGYSRGLWSLPGLRAEFPVLGALAYLNAGTDGPLPARAVQASARELERELATAARRRTSNAAPS